MLEISFKPFPILENEKLLLRPLEMDDAAEVLALRGNLETMKFIPRPLLKNHEEALEFITLIQSKVEKSEAINWAVTCKGIGKLIGIVGHYKIYTEHFRSEIGYMLLPEYHNKGITTQVIQLLLEYGFNKLQLHSIEAVIDPNNFASARVLEKNGFIKEGHFIENEYFNGKFIDSAVYSILKRNYLNCN